MRPPSQGHLLAAGALPFLTLLALVVGPGSWSTAAAQAQRLECVSLGYLKWYQSHRGHNATREISCGRAPLNRLPAGGFKRGGGAPRVVNGEDSRYGEFPSYARVIFADRSHCGGTLVSGRHVLTAAHCVDHMGKLAAPRDVTVRLGDFARLERDQHEVELEVVRLSVASRFEYVHGQHEVTHDWALLELRDRVHPSRHVEAACLPQEDEMPPTSGPQALCYLVGFGATLVIPRHPEPRREYPRYLQRMRVEQTGCEPWGVPDSDTGRVCFKKAPQEGTQGDSCTGDSGGPVLCRDPKSHLWTLVASVSYGTKYCDGAEPEGWVGVYANFHKVLKNIHDECQ